MALNPPISPPSERKGLLTRFGLTGGQKKGAVATEIIARIQADLPPTDPLRRARVQTHLFLAQLPAFPVAKDAAGQGANLAPPPRDVIPDPDPVRRDSNDARASHRKGETPRPPSALRARAGVGQGGSAAARAAAARSPARVALAQGRPLPSPISQISGPAAPNNRSLNALVLLVVLLGAAIFSAVGWYGVRWYQQLSAAQEADLTPDQGLNPAVPADEGASGSISIPTREGEPALDPIEEIGEGQIIVEGSSTPVPSSADISAAAYEDAVLLLERDLARNAFLQSEFVDTTYTLETRDALQKVAQAFSLTNLEQELATFGLSPTREDLDRWYQEIRPIFN